MKKWYLSQRPALRLLITFVFDCLLWVLMECLIQLVWQDEDYPLTWKRLLFKSLFMGTVWVFIFSMPLVRQVFGKKNNRSDAAGTGPSA